MMPALASVQQGELEAGSRRKVTRQLSFQRYCHASRLLRGQQHMLSKVGSWKFDIFLFDRLTNGNSLVTLMCHLFNVYGLVQHFQLDMVKLHRFLGRFPTWRKQLSPLDVFLGLTAAAAHDVDHPGVNQPFLIKTRHHLASLYQDMEQQLGSLILATDISRQNEFLSTFREHLHHQSLDLQQAPNRHFILQIALKCADVCNPCRAWELSRQWSERVCEEFYRQGDIEKKFDLEVSPLCNQQGDSVPAIQIGFISYIVEPLFEEWSPPTPPTPTPTNTTHQHQHHHHHQQPHLFVQTLPAPDRYLSSPYHDYYSSSSSSSSLRRHGRWL
ncbi:hypothetical protein CRUP_027996 [Coryphaenoides rupestris]|nr:hypothetical protein CRUP_027996 [Coryphaenoides rupestris]